ncbi:helix-turn-helix domain-containing protein [Sphaerisporangium siamense]|uniref:helix-turn-helix domain-containing protein n=1 Tax=Sphaerisporangium siamense TaxID=795645 RepID=UPI0027DA749D|nr:helix-turn-helix transcriptional regulator [Sphaerisporangium siamense]
MAVVGALHLQGVPVTGQDLIGQRIKTIRRQRGLSQAQLAHPELSDSYVSLIESGKRTPTAAVLELLAAKLDCSLTYLINGVTAEQMQELELGLRYASLALNNGEVTEARRRYAELLEDGSLAGLISLRQEAEYGYALASEACGDLDEAISVLCRLREPGSDPLPPDRSIAVAIALSRCYRESGDLAAAVRVGEEAIIGPARPAWTDDLVELGATLLSAYELRNDMLRAEQFAAELLSAAEMLGTPRATVAACWNAAIVAERTGRIAEALAFGERALAIQSENGAEPRNLARLRLAVAVLRFRASPAEAEACRDLFLRGERELTESSGSVADRARCAVELAKVEMALHNPDKAAGYARRANELAQERPRSVRADAHLVLGNALLSLGRTEEAAAELVAAEDLLSSSPVTRKTAEGWLTAATALERMDDGEASVAAYQQALACVGL